MRHLALLLCVCAAFAARPAAGQTWFDRPQLARTADVNDWEAYYEYAVEHLRSRPALAEAGFYWASRLAPQHAEPLFGQWVAFWLKDVGRWEAYLRDNRRVVESPAVVAADSLRLRALSRNPFVHQGLEILLVDALPGRWSMDSLTRGWMAYAATDFPRAVRLFGRGLRRGSGIHARVRFLRAQAFVEMKQYDSALVDLRVLADELDREDSRELVRYYESKEMLHFAIGALFAAQARDRDAEEALARSLLENLGFYPAHEFLGLVALGKAKPAAAAEHFRAALEVNPHDGLLNYRYGLALSRVGRGEEAVAAFRRAVQAEPFFAELRYELARALDAAGDREGAVAAYDEYVRLAPRKEAQRVRTVRARQEALGRG